MTILGHRPLHDNNFGREASARQQHPDSIVTAKQQHRDRGLCTTKTPCDRGLCAITILGWRPLHNNIGNRGLCQQHRDKGLCTTTLVGQRPVHDNNIGREASAQQQYWDSSHCKTKALEHGLYTTTTLGRVICKTTTSGQRPLHNNNIGTWPLRKKTTLGQDSGAQ
jgi:hypothetical protein